MDFKVLLRGGDKNQSKRLPQGGQEVKEGKSRSDWSYPQVRHIVRLIPTMGSLNRCDLINCFSARISSEPTPAAAHASASRHLPLTTRQTHKSQLLEIHDEVPALNARMISRKNESYFSARQLGRRRLLAIFRRNIIGFMNEVTRFLNAAEQGDPNAAARLLPLVYDELRRLAAAKMAGEGPGHTLDATALVHEAYVRLVGDRVRRSQPFLPRRRRGDAARS